MAEIVNFRQAKKRHDAAEKARQASTNRAKHGRTAAEKSKEAALLAKQRDMLEGAKRDKNEP